MVRPQWFDVSAQDINEWKRLCPVGQFRVVSGSSLPGPLPPEFKEKCPSALVMASGSGGKAGVTYYMVNYNRVDGREMDQQPFAMVFSGSAPFGSGTFVHHGDWEGRTTKIPDWFEGVARATQAERWLDLSEMPLCERGELKDLKVRSQFKAFDYVITRLKSQR